MIGSNERFVRWKKKLAERKNSMKSTPKKLKKILLGALLLLIDVKFFVSKREFFFSLF